MAYPASQEALASLFNRANAVALRIQDRAQLLVAKSLAGLTQRRELTDYQLDLDRAITLFNIAKATPGMPQYAKDQFDDQNLDIALEFTSMVTEATSLRDWIFNNFPKDVGGAALIETLTINGVLTPLTFNTAQLQEFRDKAALLIASIS